MSRECWGCRVKPSERAKCEERSKTGFKEWQRHHVLPQQIIRREFPGGVFGETAYPPEVEFRSVTLKELLADERNLIWMREYHHQALEARHLIIHLQDVPAEARAFADELGMGHHLERLYPTWEETFDVLSRAAVTPAPTSDVEDLEAPRDERWEP